MFILVFLAMGCTVTLGTPHKSRISKNSFNPLAVNVIIMSHGLCSALCPPPLYTTGAICWHCAASRNIIWYIYCM